MTVATSLVPSRRGNDDAGLSTSYLAAMLIGASAFELVILRIGTRTAIHIPGIESVQGPYRLVAGAGRLAFAMAVVLLAVLLARLVRDFHRRDLDYLSTSVLGFALAAVLARAGVVDRDALAAVTVTVVVVLAIGVFSARDRFVATPIGLCALAFAIVATASMLHSGTGVVSTGTLAWLTLRSEELAVLAAIVSGPLVRRGLGLTWLPPRRLVWPAVGTAAVVIGATVANPSSTHILMLWNFGLTGVLPAGVYGLAAASLVVSIASAVRHDQPGVAAALVLLLLGGIGLISTYQSGLTIAGLALAATPGGNAEADRDRRILERAR